MEQPNIFDYATSELSQDAFICYLLAFGTEKYKNDFPKEYETAHKFLERCGISAHEEILEIKKQYYNIDVLIVTKSHLLIVEDKTGTNEHDDQIIKYVKTLKNNQLSSGRKIKVCYLKTMDYVRAYQSSDKNILSQSDCCSLNRKDLLDLLEKCRQCNIIYESFYSRLNMVNERANSCNDKDIFDWNKEKWFAYLSSALKGRNFNIGWVNNARGGFYACWLDWEKCGNGEDYKQIEISFEDGKTSRVKLCLKFSSANKETTLNSKSLIKDLQNKAVTQGYKASNRMGKATTYAYKEAENKTDVQDFINNAS